MNEMMNRRYTGTAPGLDEDPLAELARIVGSNDPFADLFNDARTDQRQPQAVARQEPRFEPPRQDAHYDPQRYAPPARQPLAYEDEAGEPEDLFEGEVLRGGYDADPQGGTHHVEAADPYAPVDEDGYEDPRFAPDPNVEYSEQESYAQESYSYDEPERRRGGSRFLLVGALLLVAVGGAAGYAWKSGVFHSMNLPGLGGRAPLITASADPVKVVPKADAGSTDPDSSTKEIFERIGQTQASAPEKVVSREETPGALVPAAKPLPGKPLPVKPLPTKPVAALPVAIQPLAAMPLPADQPLPATRSIASKPVATADAGAASDDAGSFNPQAPRRVRTVKVLSDGTVVTGESSEPAHTLPTGMPPMPVNSGAGTQEMASVAPATVPAADPTPDATPDQDATASVDAPTPAAAPLPSEVAKPVVTILPPARPRIVNVPAKPKPAANSMKPMQLASLDGTLPAAPATVSTASAGSGFVVQVASQKSEADALSTYRGLQQKFSAVLGGMKPSIRRADLGDRGTFYRIRVGPMASRDEATNLCIKLKAAGGDCVVARN